MGGCYSNESDTAIASPPHKLPADRLPGHAERKPRYSPLTNGDSEHEEDEVLKQSIILLSTDTVQPTVSSQLLPEDAEKAKGVAPSDSGIESIGPAVEECNCEAVEKKEVNLCRSCHNKLKRISCGACDPYGQFHLDTSELPLLRNGNTYCVCGPQQTGKGSICQAQSSGSKACASVNRYSDIPTRLLKSNLKKHGQEKRDSKHVRMSWKSADSLDLNSAMTTCMDRAKSEASDVFGDDISFRAPLAHFDSVSNQLDVEIVEDEDDDKFFTSRMSIYSEILELASSICHSEFSETPSEDHHSLNLSVSEGQSARDLMTRQPYLSRSAPSQSTDQLYSNGWPEKDKASESSMSKLEGRLGSSPDCDIQGAMVIEERGLTLSSSPFGHVASNVSENLSDELCPVSVVVKGRHIVMMDARTYCQLLSDVHELQNLLQQLSQVLQVDKTEEMDRVKQMTWHRNAVSTPLTAGNL